MRVTDFLISLVIVLLILLESEFVDYLMIGSLSIIRLGSIVIIFIIGLYNIFKIRHRLIISINRPIVTFILYILFILISSLWSQNILSSLTSSIGILFVLIYSLSVYKYDPDRIALNFHFIIFLLVVISLITFFFNKNITTDDVDFFRFKGLMSHSQRLSILISTAIIVSVVMLLNKDRKILKLNKIFYYLIGSKFLFFAVLILTKTRAFSTFLIIIILVLLVKNITLFRYMIIPVLFTVVIAYFYYDVGYLLEIFYQRGDSDVAQLTGRIPLWLDTYELFKEKKALGYGFGAFKEGYIQYPHWKPGHAHNMWIHSLFEVGIIGTFFLLLFSITTLIYSFKQQRKISFTFPLMLYTLFCGLTGIILGFTMTTLYGILLIFISLEFKNKVKFKI